MADVLAQSRDRVLVCDGAMGTMLHAAGHAYDGTLAALNLTRPEVVAAIHEGYVAAGADIIQTNTFGASRLRLALQGYADAVREINLSAAKIARGATRGVDRPVFVAGSVSPAVTVEQRTQIHPDERVMVLREQLEALDEAGVDLVILETFGHLDELVEAVEVARGFGFPIVAQATFAENGLTLSGHSAADCAAALADRDVSVIGMNCTVGPRKLVPVVAEMAGSTTLPLSVQPNAGKPERLAPDQHVRFAVDPDYFASYVRPFVEAGAVIVGGCCGTTPATIRAVAEEASRLRPTRRAAPSPERRDAVVPGRTLERPAGLAERLARHEFLVGVELATAGGTGIDEAVALANRLRGSGVDLFFVPSEAGAGAQFSPLSLAIALRQRMNVEPILAVATWHKSLIALQAEMLGAHALGIHNIVCETGDPLPIGDYPMRHDAHEVDSLGLATLLSRLNDGRDSNDLTLQSGTEFVIGARCNLGGEDVEAEIARMLTHKGAGAEFAVTWPIYDADGLQRLHEATSSQRISVLAAIRPLQSEDEAAYLFHEVPDVRLPRAYLEAMQNSGPRAGQRGVELAEEVLRSIRPMVSGVIISAERTDQLEALVEAALRMRATSL